MGFKDFDEIAKKSSKKKEWGFKFNIIKKTIDWEYPLRDFFKKLFGTKETK